MGQFLALRPDLIPQEYCDELLKLVDSVPVFPWPEAEAILTSELGRPPSEVFAYFNRRPVAAGSLAQVHLARLKDGTEVAVKVQRPRIEEAIRRDLGRARIIAGILEKSGATFVAAPREVVEEVRVWLAEEIDFKSELANMQRLHLLARGSAFQRIPEPYPAYCTGRVLTVEYLRGTPVSSVLAEVRAGRGPDGAVLRDVDLELYASRLMLAVLTQIFRFQFFHADLHPGNLLVLPGNVVGFVDFGLCDELAGPVRKSQFRYFAAVYSGDSGSIFKALTEVLIPGELTDMEKFHRDFLEETRRWEGQHAADGSGQGERSPLAQYLIGVMRAARRNHLKVPIRVLSMYRALLTVESLATQLGSTEGLREVGTNFFGELQREEVFEGLFDRENAERLVVSLLGLKQNAPGQLQQILSDVSQGNLTLKTEVTESQKSARLHNQRARMMVLAVLSVGVSLLLARPEPLTVHGISSTGPLSALLVVLYVWCFLIWRRL